MLYSLLLKAGVDISRLNREIRRTLNDLADICLDHESDLIITSTYEGRHSPSSLHYANDAIDIRIIPEKTQQLVEEIKQKLGPDFDVIFEFDHIHIEYDPKNRGGAAP